MSDRNGSLNGDDASALPSGEKRKRGFPAPVTILTLVLILVWVAAFFIPSGQYELDASGSPVVGSYRLVPSPLDFEGRVRDLLLAPVNGMYGIQDPATGQVGPFNKGMMFGSIEVFLFILSIGGFMTVVFATGALDLGIHHLSYRFRERGPLLIVVLSLLFGILGSIKGWSDETLGLYAMMVPLMIALGYDRIVTVSVVTVAPFVGALGSTINPFATGIGSSKAGVSIADGIGLRLLLFALTIAATVLYTLWYARRVKADPTRSLCGISDEDAALARADSRAPEPLSATDAIVIGLVFATFGLLAFSIVPWGAILNNAAVDPYTEKTINSPLWWELGWWLPELSALFFVMAIVVGIVGRLGEETTAKAFIKGVIEFTGPAFLVTLARSVSVVMTNTKTIDTVLHAMEGLVTGASSVAFVMLTFAGSLPLSFLVGGGAAGTALTMPVLAPLGDFAGVDRAVVITTWTAAAGWLRLIVPVNAILIAGLALAKVGFDQYVKFIVPLLGVLLVVILAVLLLGVTL
ncbi:MAG TPA: hypothetical protein VGG86_10720 [Roseiarcus sp.]|jgi:uncharacterized ion transporter superfamily protein YfcC